MVSVVATGSEGFPGSPPSYFAPSELKKAGLEKREGFVLGAGLLLSAIPLKLIVWRWLVGVYYYLTEYIRAALGDDVLEIACASVRSDINPWSTLMDTDWFKLQRCLGNEAGFDRRGELWLSAYDAAVYIVSYLSILGPLPTLVGISFFGLWLLPRIFNRIGELGIYLYHAPKEILGHIFSVALLLIVVTTWSLFPFEVFLNTVGGVFAVLALIFAYNIWIGEPDWARSDIIVLISPTYHTLKWAVVGVYSIFGDILPLISVTASTIFFAKKCYHGQDCFCFAQINVSNSIYDDLLRTQADLDRARNDFYLLEDERNTLQYQLDNMGNNRRGPHTPMHSPASTLSPGSPNFSRSLSQTSGTNPQTLQRDKSRLLAQNVELINEVRSQRRTFDLKIKNLQAQLDYARGDGNAVIIQSELEDTKLRLGTMTKEFNEVNSRAMRLQQELYYRKQNDSQDCSHNPSAPCQLAIRTLETEKDLLFKKHQENDLMVQDAAIDFGKSPEEARHYNLRMYLQEITQALVQQIAAHGLVSHKNQPIYQNLFNKMDTQRARELEAYKGRLEVEVHRLGGDVQIIRLGLDPKRPPPISDLSWDTFEAYTFDVYLQLCAKVTYLHKLFAESRIKIPTFEPPWVRGNEDNERQQSIIDLLDKTRKIVTKPKYEHSEILLQTLARDEIQRLLGLAVHLRTAVANEYRFQKPDSAGSVGLWEERINTPLEETRVIIRNAAMTLDDIRPLEKRYTWINEGMLAERMDRRYKIWQAMQEAIHWLLYSIHTFNSTPPPWRMPTQYRPTSSTPVKNFETLMRNLMKFEISTVEDRMIQLVNYLNTERFPGTQKGAPRLNGPISYQENFDGLQAAVTYAILVKNHWNDEIEPEKGPRKARLPLDHPPLIHALRREKGDVLIPLVNPFPWKLTKDGVLEEDLIITTADETSKPYEIYQAVAIKDGFPQTVWRAPKILNDQVQLDDQGQPIIGSYEEEKKWFEDHTGRVKQLLAFVQASQKPMKNPYRPIILKQGKEVTTTLMKSQVLILDRNIRELLRYARENGIVVPIDWPCQGGPLGPTAV